MNQKQKWVLIGLGLLFILASSYYASLNDAFSFIFLGAISLILLGAIFQKPYLGIVFMLCMLPLELYAALPANLKAFTSLTSLFGLAALLFFVLRTRKFLAGSRTADKYFYIFAVLLFLVVMTGEALKPVSTGISYPFTYIQLLILVWLSERLFTTRQQIESLMKYFISANILAVLISLPSFDVIASSTDINRLSGLQGNANEFAVYLSIAIVMIVYFFMTTSRKRTRILLVFMAIILIIPLILSGSRGAILFVFPVIALQLWQFRNNKIILTIFFLTVLIMSMGLVGPYLPKDYIQRIVSIPQDIIYGRDTLSLRYGLWQYGLELWSPKPFLGIGSGLFRIYSINSPVLHGTGMLGLHNTYLTFLVENGLVGLFFFLLLIARSIINYSRVIRSADKDSHLGGLAITWQAMMLLLLLNGAKGDWNTNKLLWVCLALSLVVGSFQRNTAEVESVSESPDLFASKRYQIK